jgi:hypothetical protein
MGESAFTNQNKKATEFREWLESVGGTDEKLAEGTFNDPSLPVNTGANARMVVIDKSAQAVAEQSKNTPNADEPQPEPTLKEARQYAKDNGLDEYIEHFDGMGRAAALNLSKADRAVIADMYAGKPYSTSTKPRAGGGAATPGVIAELRRQLSALEALRKCLG